MFQIYLGETIFENYMSNVYSSLSFHPINVQNSQTLPIQKIPGVQQAFKVTKQQLIGSQRVAGAECRGAP